MNQTQEEYELATKKHQEQMDAYRALNENLMYQASQNFDKYLITLSAGSLGLSLTFLSTMFKGKDLHSQGFLFTAWACWLVSIMSILYSFATSAKSHSNAIDQVDKGTAHEEKIGGHSTTITQILSIVGGVSFFIAIFSICFFVGINIKGDKKCVKENPSMKELHQKYHQEAKGDQCPKHHLPRPRHHHRPNDN